MKWAKAKKTKEVPKIHGHWNLKQKSREVPKYMGTRT